MFWDVQTQSPLKSNFYGTPRQRLTVLSLIYKQFFCIFAIASDFKRVGKRQARSSMKRIILRQGDAFPQVFFSTVLIQSFHRLLSCLIPRYLLYPLRVLANLGHLINHFGIRQIGIDDGIAKSHDSLYLFHRLALLENFLNLLCLRIIKHTGCNQQLLHFVRWKRLLISYLLDKLLL